MKHHFYFYLLGLAFSLQSVQLKANPIGNIANVRESNSSKIPSFIQFQKGKEPQISQIRQWLTENYKMDPKFEFLLLNQESDQLGFIHYRYQQTYNGIPIETTRMILHTKKGLVQSLNGLLFDVLPASETKPSVDEKSALKNALKHVNAKEYKWQNDKEETFLKESTKNSNASYYPKGTLVYTFIKEQKTKKVLRLAYKFDIYANKPLYRAYVYVDAITTKVINEEKRIHHIDVPGTAHTAYSGTQTITVDNFAPNNYRLRETGRGNGIETYNLQNNSDYSAAVDFIDTDNNWNNINSQLDQYATDLHWGTEKTYDYYFTKFNRNSIDNNGFKLKSYLHYQYLGSADWVGAFWDGDQMTYGDGSPLLGYLPNPMTCIDVVGHEITHGLTEHTAGLYYEGESGGLNESFSDIFGQAIKYFAKPTSFSWLFGNEAGGTGTSLRDFTNPNNQQCPKTYFGNYWDPYQEVHNISGVQDYWFYLISVGGSGTNDNGDSYTVAGIGIENAAKIAYRNLTVYLTPTSNYADARYYSIQSAIDLFGVCSPEVISVGKAWHAVGIGPAYSNTVQSNFNAIGSNYCSVPSNFVFNNTSNNGTNYAWSFGDGTISTSPNPTHTYSAIGTYTIKLVTNGGSCGKDSITKTITINPFNPCPVYMPSNGSTSTFTSCSGTLMDNGGVNDILNIKSHVIIAPVGATQLTLNISEFDYQFPTNNYTYLEIFAGPDSTYAPIGVFSNYNLMPGQSLFINSGVVSIYQKILMEVAGNTYYPPGFTLNWECSSLPSKPIAWFIGDSLDINIWNGKFKSCSGLINFNDLSTNNPTSWYWDFGDGTTSTIKNPTHQYPNSINLYTVTLVASNAVGSSTISNVVSIGYCLVTTVPGCSNCTSTLTACKGVLSDQYGLYSSYFNNQSYTCAIIPPGANQIKIQFPFFEYENHNDSLCVYKGLVPNPSNLVGCYSGFNLPNGGAPIIINSNSIVITHYSNETIQANGFRMDWECINDVGLFENNLINNESSIYPNPASNKIILQSSVDLTNIKLFDITGKEVFNTKINNAKQYSINVGSFDNGTYLIEITDNNGEKAIKKFIKISE